jgi:hypothetical protein
VRRYQVSDGKELPEAVQHTGFRKSVWQDIWRCRRRTAVVFFVAVTILLWSAPTARTYELLHELLIILLVMTSMAYPVIHLIYGAASNTRRADHDRKLLDTGLLLIDCTDSTGIIWLALLSLMLVSASMALTYVPALRKTLQAPLPFAAGRWIAAILTSIAVTMLCHMLIFNASCCLRRTQNEPTTQ